MFSRTEGTLTTNDSALPREGVQHPKNDLSEALEAQLKEQSVILENLEKQNFSLMCTIEQQQEHILKMQEQLNEVQSQHRSHEEVLQRQMTEVLNAIRKPKWRKIKEATEELLWIVTHSQEPSTAAVLECVEEGADIYHSGSELARPILHTLIERGDLETIRELMTRIQDTPLLLTVCDKAGDTPLHVLCSPHLSESAVDEMLKAIVKRILDNTVYTTTVDWNKCNNENRDFLSAAAAVGRLNVVWKYVRHVPFFGDQPYESIVISNATIQMDDWRKLSVHDQKCFHDYKIRKQQEVQELQRKNTTFLHLCMNARWAPPTHQVRECLRNGADPMCPYKGQGPFRQEKDTPIIFSLLEQGSFEQTLACLESPYGLDFTRVDEKQRTLLHVIAEGIPEKLAVEILQKIVEHLEKHKDRDRIDWTLADMHGYDWLTIAADSGRLSSCWGVLKANNVSHYFKSRSESKIPIWAVVGKSDWSAMCTEDQIRFDLKSGIN